MTPASPPLREIHMRCHWCQRVEGDLIGTLRALQEGTHVGAYACQEADRDECIRLAMNRLRRRGRGR
jgi:hypothetical protein